MQRLTICSVSAETPIWLNFWLVILNNQAESAKWEFTTSDALALMGSHTLIDNQVRVHSRSSLSIRMSNVRL